jgi:hypothetical protein
MSAYMPVKHSWGLEALRPTRWTLRIAARLVAAVILFLLVSLVLPAILRAGNTDLAQLPAISSGSVAAQSVSAARDHGFIVIQGEAANKGAKPARNLEAVVEVFDANGGLRGVESALVEMPAIAAREESPFIVRLPDPGEVKSFRVRFRPLAGGAR